MPGALNAAGYLEARGSSAELRTQLMSPTNFSQSVAFLVQWSFRQQVIQQLLLAHLLPTAPTTINTQQVALSFQLPFAMVPLVYFTSCRWSSSKSYSFLSISSHSMCAFPFRLPVIPAVSACILPTSLYSSALLPTSLYVIALLCYLPVLQHCCCVLSLTLH